MIAPTTIPVPEGTTAIYITAISLCTTPSEVSVGWADSSAQFGTTFVGPSSTHVLADKVFGSPVTVVAPIPKKITVSFNFQDTMTTQHSVTAPVTTKAGPAGTQTIVTMSGYAAGDRDSKLAPTTVTLVMKRPL